MLDFLARVIHEVSPTSWVVAHSRNLLRSDRLHLAAGLITRGQVPSPEPVHCPSLRASHDVVGSAAKWHGRKADVTVSGKEDTPTLA